MLREHRHFLPNQLWHLSHCCRENAFSLQGTHALREPKLAYKPAFSGKTGSLRVNNTVSWEEKLESPGT